MHSRTECLLCNSERLIGVTERFNVPVHQNMLYNSLEAARGVSRGHLRIVACLDCGFVFNATFDPELMRYGAGYENDQTYSPAFTSHVEKLLTHLLARHEVRNSCIVEVGCGKGDFLRMLVEDESSGNVGWGFDPSYLGPDRDLEGRLNFVRSFYPEEHAHISANFVICRHVIEHVPDPATLFARIHKNGNDALLFLETKDVEWVLANAVIWDFFYEYCCYFSPRSIANALQQVGFAGVSSRHMFGGQYLWVEASTSPGRIAMPRNPEARTQRLVDNYVVRESEMSARWNGTINSLRESGGVALWGAGAKGGTFASLFDPRAEILSCVVDLNPAKQGRFIAGSGHPIVAPSELRTFGVESVVLMNPNYLDEVRDLLAREKISVNLITEPEVTRAAYVD
jgi:SAM-dependent methyltransferase